MLLVRASATLAFLIFSIGCGKAPVRPQSEEASPKAPEIGRYQLFSAEYDRLTTKSVVREKAVFRIDTVTGKVEVWYPSTLGEKGDRSFWGDSGS